MVDRGIRESGCIDMESLCIVPGEKVWGVMIDIHVLSDQGNIFDACGLGSHRCFAHRRRALLNGSMLVKTTNLLVNGTPIMASFTRVGGRFVLDANEEEELGWR